MKSSIKCGVTMAIKLLLLCHAIYKFTSIEWFTAAKWFNVIVSVQVFNFTPFVTQQNYTARKEMQNININSRILEKNGFITSVSARRNGGMISDTSV